jgi:hypothetical protein
MHSGADDRWLNRPGFPIRTSQDQSLIASSLGLIAGFHVLHRLLTPRHPPHALSCLIISTLRRHHPSRNDITVTTRRSSASADASACDRRASPQAMLLLGAGIFLPSNTKPIHLSKSNASGCEPFGYLFGRVVWCCRLSSIVPFRSEPHILIVICRLSRPIGVISESFFHTLVTRPERKSRRLQPATLK